MSQPNTAFDPANSNLQNPNLTGSNLPVPVDPMLARLAQKANSATMRQEIEQAQNQQRRYVPQINLQPQPNYQNFPTFNYPNPNLPSQNQPRQNPNFVAPTKKKSRLPSRS